MTATRRTVTYFGRRAHVSTILKGRKRLGERITITHWIDDADDRNGGHKAGTIVASHIDGDGQTADFRHHADATFTSLAEATDWATERLS